MSPVRPMPRLVEVVGQMLDAETPAASTGTRSRLMRRVTARVEELHGPGVVPLPGRTAFYALIDRLSVGRHTFGSAVTRRQLANRPDGVFTPTFAARPGEQIQIDSTPMDVMVLAGDGVPARADLTIAVDVATRTHLRGGAAADRHQGGRRGAAAGPDAGARADAAGLAGGAADVGVGAAVRSGWSHRRAACGTRPRGR